ncbi:alpha-glucan family phosphorylase [candidate division KSB1 bacterium]|nr:alpha-glucan family phosphorylase [candidate division KSB1 bacterium]
MKPIQTFTIIPSLPEKLSFLRTLAYNLWWSWNHNAIDLFRRLDRDLWESTNHNPIKMLGQINQAKLDLRSEEDGYLAQMDRVRQELENYLNEQTWYEKSFGKTDSPQIAYFSAEFGLTECVPIYSGGLGILAGDHFKSASDLGLPFIGVGLLYQQGYFHQFLNADGWQSEKYPKNDFYNMPVQLLKNEHGDPLIIDVDFPGRKVFAQIWKIRVGRNDLFLLDTNVDQNDDEDKQITGELYGGDNERRIQQEIVLGIGGVRALKLLNINPTVFHMNEGHSAFLALERISICMEEKKLNFDQAKELTKAGNVFTTHTPVPAGIDRFPIKLMEKYFSSYFPKFKISKTKFCKFGKLQSGDSSEKFSMAILAINLASHINGVSKLHGKVSKKMWQDLWKGVPENEIPISSVTNGIHPDSYISRDLAGLYDRYLGPSWRRKPADLTIWKRVDQIPGEELWRTHERRRERLVSFARIRLNKQLANQGAQTSEIERVEDILNPDALTIGFARRFATYKRADLLFHDPERLAKILSQKDRPVQIIFAGKAHPKDEPGKKLIKEIAHYAQQEEFRTHIVFIENYDIVVARYLVQGVDIWLNTPRRFMEASGTSGMKAAVNGVLNVSILDGWWDEAYSRNVGWAIGSGESYEDHEYQDKVESEALYNLLENEVIPLFYKRGKSNVPRRWVELMKNSLSEICPFFNTNRMVREYTEWYYAPAMNKFSNLYENDFQKAKEIAEWKNNIQKNWKKVHFISVEQNGKREYQVGKKMSITAKIKLDGLNPDDVNVEIYHGFLNSDNIIENGKIDGMSCSEDNGDNVFTFTGNISCQVSGLYGYTVRIIPKIENLNHPHETGLIHWAS